MSNSSKTLVYKGLICKNLIRKTLLSIAVAAIATGPVQAEETGADALKSAPVVVTATRFAASIDTAPVNIITITAEDIANSSATTLAGVLKYQAGVHVSDLFGISGSKSRVDLGGFGENGSQNTLVLLNGRRLNDVDLQGANLAAIPLDSIAQVEIVHGSATVLYGDNAVGGVINIVTKNAFDGEHASAKLIAGSYQTQRLTTDLRKTINDVALSLAVDGMQSNGYRNNSAFENASLMGELSKDADDWTYGARLNVSGENIRLPGPLNEPEYKADPEAASGTIERAKENRYGIEGFLASESMAMEIAFRRKHQEATVFGDSEADLRTLSLTPRVKHQYGRHALIAGIDVYRSSLDTQSVFGGAFPARNSSDTTRNSYAVYLTDTIAFGKHTALDLGLRRQHVKVDIGNSDELTGTDTRDKRSDDLNAWNITLSHKHPTSGRNYLRLASSFRYPVLDEMWNYYFGTINLLKPQRGRHLELGTQQDFNNGMRFNANLFRMNLKDEITYDLATASNLNLDTTRHDGINLGLRAPLAESLSLQAGYAWRKASFRSGSSKGKDVPLVPHHKFTLSGQYVITGDAQLGLDAIYTGSRPFGNDYANTGKEMPGYTRLDLNYSQRFGAWRGRILVQNLTNIKTADAGFYNTFTPNPYYYYPLPERAVYLSFEGDL